MLLFVNSVAVIIMPSAPVSLMVASAAVAAVVAVLLCAMPVAAAEDAATLRADAEAQVKALRAIVETKCTLRWSLKVGRQSVHSC